MKTRLYIILLLFQATAAPLYAQCGYLAGKITDISGAMPLVASLSAKTEQGTALVLLDAEGDRKSSREDVAGARDDFPALRAALAEWTARAGGEATI